jgi:radical SAM protein with 4Fe4S-binding SPASM domain
LKTVDKYPVVASKWFLFHQPEGGYLKQNRDDSACLTGEIWDLTDLSVSTLLLCNGTRTVTQILNAINDTCEASDFSPAESAAKFLHDSLQNGIIEFQDYPQQRLIIEKGSKEKFYPLHFAIELTDACNLSCGHCYRESGPGLAHRLPTDTLLNLLHELHKNGVQSLELSGGEPTVHPDFVQILSFSLQHFGSVAILTNGTRFTEPIYDILGEYHDKAYVQVDLDGCNEKQHDKLRGAAGAFKKATTVIRELSKRRVRVSVAMSLHAENYHSIEETYILAKQLGAKRFIGSPVIDIGRAKREMLLSWEQLQKAMKCLNALAQKDPDTVLTSTELKRLGGKLGSNCGAGSRSLALGPDGRVRPCFLVNKEIPTFKNAVETSLGEVLDDAPLSFLRNIEPPCPELCHDCLYVVFCYGCIARPLIAWDRAQATGKPFRCHWSESTNFGKRMGIVPYEKHS